MESLSAAGAPCAPVNSLAGPQTVRNRTIVEFTHPLHGRYKAVRNPLRLSCTPSGPVAIASTSASRPREFLRELGPGKMTIVDLLARGIVAESI